MSKLPLHTLRRAQISPSNCNCANQVRHATLLRRPNRPYTFTQLVTLSDGSTYTQRTTSPQPIFKSTKDSRNHPLWQPSMTSLKNIEEDEAGRLRAFRQKFGRGWDAENTVDENEDRDHATVAEDSLMDLISGTIREGTGRGQGKTDREDGKEEGEQKMITVRKDGILVKVPAMSRHDRRSKK